MRYDVFDLETDGLDATVIWCLGVCDLFTGEYREYSDYNPRADGSLAEGIARLEAAEETWAHNGTGFDVPTLHKFGSRIDRHKLFDTLVLKRLFDPERRQGHALDTYGPKREFSDFSKWTPEMSEYMKIDVEICRQLALECRATIAEWEKPRAIRLEHDAAWWIANQMSFGFAFDSKAAQLLQADLAVEREAKKQEAFKYIPRVWWKDEGLFVPKKDHAKFGYVEGVEFTKVKLIETNIGSEDQLARHFLKNHGWKPKEFTDNGKPKMGEDVLRAMPYPEAQILADYARLDKMWSQVAAAPKANGGGGWLHHVRADGRIHGYVNSNGAVTGRMTHSKPNTANTDKKDLRLRRCWIANPAKRKKLVGCDAEGLELRMFAHYLHRWDGGAYASAVVSGSKEEGTDPHTLTLKAVGLYKRDNAKRVIYAMLYGAGDYKIGLIIKEDYMEKHGSPMKGNPAKLGAAARKKLLKGIRGMDALSEIVKKRAKLPGYVKGLDGRRIFCRSQHSALNTLLQGGGAIVMKVALVLAGDELTRLYGPHGDRWGFVANVHDEFQIECDEDIAEQVGAIAAESIKQAGVVLDVKCPLAGKYVVGNNWADTH